jgi:hypothetical protein
VTDTPVDQDVVDILTTDHRQVLDLLQQIKIAPTPKNAVILPTP